MNQKYIGIILLVIGVFLAGITYTSKVREDVFINTIIESQGGSCYLSDGTCLHSDSDYTPQIFGGILAAMLVSLGAYLLLFDKTQQMLAKQHMEVAYALKDARKESDEKEKFEAFIAAFTDEEQKVLKAIKEQEGIKQSTLRFRTGMSKTALSLLLKSLEERDIISRKPSGKTNEVFLRTRF